jgi:NAD(P)-dependent dehydrogenase (short-subunit alcohol dehydrogenase family)
VDRFEGKVAIVTGAGSGLGQATARRLAAEGAKVACLDIAGDAAKATAGAIGDAAIAVQVDIADQQSVHQAVAEAAGALGRPSVLCNVAGIGGMAHSVDETLEHWNRVIAVNLTGTFLMCQATLPHLLDGGGVIVNVASSSGLTGNAYSAAYCASKGGVVLLTKALADEYVDKGVRVCGVAPGGIDTPLLNTFGPPEGANLRKLSKITSPLGFATPDDIANAVLFAASDEATFIVGAIISVDAGITT